MVELALKGALKVLGVDYPRVHDVAPVFTEQVRQKRDSVNAQELERIEETSLWLVQARAPAFYLEREYGPEDAQHAWQDASFVVERTAQPLFQRVGRHQTGLPVGSGTLQEDTIAVRTRLTRRRSILKGDTYGQDILRFGR